MAMYITTAETRRRSWSREAVVGIHAARTLPGAALLLETESEEQGRKVSI
jgi:hypothetical protein